MGPALEGRPRPDPLVDGTIYALGHRQSHQATYHAQLQFTPDKKHKPRRLERNSVLPAFLTCPSSAPAAGKTELVQLRPVLTATCPAAVHRYHRLPCHTYRYAPGETSETSRLCRLMPTKCAPVPQVNEVSGPMGMFFSGLLSNPGSVLTVDIPVELQNAELAAQAYLQYLRDARTLTPQELGIVTSSIARARATTTRGTPGAGRFWSLVDTADVLAATRPALPPVGLAPPLPPPLVSTQPVRPIAVYPGWWGGANDFIGVHTRHASRGSLNGGVAWKGPHCTARDPTISTPPNSQRYVLTLGS